MQITGGKVTFRRNVQPAQYEGREAAVEISFAVEEGAALTATQAMLDTAAAMAKSKVLELVSSDKAPTPPKAEGTVTTAGTKEAAAEKLNEADAKKAAAAKKAADKKAAAEKGKGDELPSTDAGKGDELPEITKNPEDRKPADTKASDPDGLDDVLDLAEGQVKEYSDKDLTDVVSRVNAKIKNPAKIKEVRGKYTDGAIATIVKEKRAAFVKEIEALAA